MEEQNRSVKYDHARRSLPIDLRPIFDEFVTDYKVAGIKHYGRPFVSYEILAEMVRIGWRPSARKVDDNP